MRSTVASSPGPQGLAQPIDRALATAERLIERLKVGECRHAALIACIGSRSKKVAANLGAC